MKLKFATFSTFPSEKDHFWQVVILPTVTVLNNIDPVDNYVAFNFEWLFWSSTLIFVKNAITK